MIDTEVVGDLVALGRRLVLELGLVSFIGGRYAAAALRRLDRRLSGSRTQTFALLTWATACVRPREDA